MRRYDPAQDSSRDIQEHAPNGKDSMHRVAHPISKVGEHPGGVRRDEARIGSSKKARGLQGLWDCVSIYPLEYSPPVGMATAAI